MVLNIIKNQYSFRLKMVCDTIDEHGKQHEDFTEEVLTAQENHGKTSLDKDTIENYVKVLNKRANDNLKAIEDRDEILEKAKVVEQFETFLETAPQTILQLYIIIQQGNPEKITWTQWQTLIKCFVFFLTGAMSNYLGPTKVTFPVLCD